MRTFIASAPGRCGIIGNPSDIYGGTVVSASIPARNRCRLTLGMAGPLPEDLRLWNAVLARFPLAQPYTLECETNVPRSSGLSGSTAMLASMLLAVLAARDEAPDLRDVTGRSAFAELVRDIERNEAAIVCGYQDAYMIVHGGMQHMEFAGKHPVNPGPPALLTPIEADLPFLLVTTGVERLSGSVHGPMAQRWLAGEPAVVKGIERITELGRLGASALSTQNWTALAECMDENHAIIADLGGSGDAIDTLIAQAKAAGARAAKLAGAGMGGTVIALADNVQELQNRLESQGYSRFMRPCRGAGVGLESDAAV